MTVPLEAELRRFLHGVRERIAVGDIVGAAGAIADAEALCDRSRRDLDPQSIEGLTELQRLLAICIEDGLQARVNLEQQLASTGAHTRAQLAYGRRPRLAYGHAR